MKILNFGSLNYDIVYSVPHIVVPGETISSTGLSQFCGGKGLNQSVALARAGASVSHAGMVGEDGAGLLSTCHEAGIDSKHIMRVEGRSGHAIIQVNQNGENSIILYAGANGENSVKHIEEALEDFGKGDILLLQNEISMLSEIIDMAYDKEMRIFLNPSPLNERVLSCNLQKISFFLMNEVEGNGITGKTEPREMLSVMMEKYPGAEVVLTLGSKGCCSIIDGKYVSVPAERVKTVDTTAAGDTFTGYFIASLVTNGGVEEAMKLASHAAAIAVGRVGAIPSIPYIEEL